MRESKFFFCVQNVDTIGGLNKKNYVVFFNREKVVVACFWVLKLAVEVWCTFFLFKNYLDIIDGDHKALEMIEAMFVI